MAEVRVSSRSARASVLCLFALFVRPAGRPMATQHVIALLETTGFDEANVRRALTRLGHTALLESTRVGRRTLWELTEAGSELADRRDAQIFSAQERAAWDGRWSVIAASVSDERRNDRYALRSRLAWVGFGQLRPGLWISPYADHEAAAVDVLTELGLVATAHTFVATTGTFTSGGSLAHEAWNLDELAARYATFLDAVVALRPRSERARFAADLRMVTEWVDLAHRDPRLPDELLPDQWSGRPAAALMSSRHLAWYGPARSWFDKVTRA